MVELEVDLGGGSEMVVDWGRWRWWKGLGKMIEEEMVVEELEVVKGGNF